MPTPAATPTYTPRLPAGTEFKTLPFEVKSVDEEQGIVTGYLSTFNNIDLGNGYIRDRVRPGAFQKTVAEAKSRREARRKKYLYPHLWMHNPEQPLGGYLDAKEDGHGLLVAFELDISTNAAGIPNNPLATMAFSGHKRGYVDEQSIGYEVIRSELVEEVVDGKKTMVRDLLELRLVEGSSVTSSFAMNPEAVDTSVKALLSGARADDLLETKATICGSTSGPIGPRDESWDGAAAKSQIFDAATQSDGSLSVATCKKYFMVLDGDPQLKASWGYPFWVVGASPHICVGAVTAIAGLIMGARGASAPDGLKPKIETLYGRINAKYPDATPLVPPWQQDGKGAIPMTHPASGSRTAHAVRRVRKTFEVHLAEEMCEDLLEDWGEVYLDALTDAVEEALRIGDTVVDDVTAALDAFKVAVLSQFVAQAVQYGLPAYLAANDGASLESGGDDDDDDDDDDDGDDGGGGGGGPALSWMTAHARVRRLSRKAGRALSALNRAKLSDHAGAIVEQAKAHQKAVAGATDAFVKAMARGAAAGVAADDEDGSDGGDDEEEEAGGSSGSGGNGNGNGQTPARGGGKGGKATSAGATAADAYDPWPGRSDTKQGRAISAATLAKIADHADAVKALAVSNTKAVKAAANSLSQLWSEEGIGPAYADEEEESPTPQKGTDRRTPSGEDEEALARIVAQTKGSATTTRTAAAPPAARTPAPSTQPGTPATPQDEAGPTDEHADADISVALTRLQALTKK